VEFVDLMRGRGFRVESTCRVLTQWGVKIAARTYRGFKARPPAARTLADQELTDAMRAIRETPDERGRLPRERFYGRRKMRALLRRKGYRDSEARVGRLMRLAGMRGLVRGRRVVTTKKSVPGAGDLLKRVFAADVPDRVWVTDLTYVRTQSGWVYVAFITDAFSRRIVACHAACHMTEKLVRDTLVIGLEDRARAGHPVPDGLVHHFDHGSVYTAVRYGEQLKLAGILPSFGTVGDSYDNALAETVNGLYKAECVGQDGPFATLADVLAATLDWVHWYNTSRLHEYLDYRTPDEVEEEYYSHIKPLETQPVTQ
jgi:transposase InsO family protein